MADPFTIAMAGVSLIQGAQQDKATADQAAATMGSVAKQAEQLRKQKQYLEKYYDERRGYMTDSYGNKVTSILDSVGQNLYDARERSDFTSGRTGLSYSGTTQKSYQTATDYMKRDATNKYKNVNLEYQTALSDLEAAKEREFGQIDMQLTQLEGQFNAAQEYLK